METKKGDAVDLNRLLRESMALVSHIDTQGVPAIQRNLNQLDAFSRKLAAKAHPKADTYTDAQAQMFFAGQGLDLSKQQRTLRTIDLSRAYESLEPLSDLDVEKALDHHYQMTFAAAIEESTELTAVNARRHYVHRIEDDWEATKRDLLDAYGHRLGAAGIAQSFGGAGSGIGAGGDAGDGDEAMPAAGASTPLNRSMLSRSLAGTAKQGSKSTMSYEQTAYAKAVNALNTRRNKHEAFGVITTFKDTARAVDEFNDRRGGGADESDVVDCWELQRCMVGERDVRDGDFKTSGSEALGESVFQREYLQGKLRLRQQLINGARVWAERLYAEYIRAVIEQNRTAARVKGEPGLIPNIKGFLNVNRSSWPQGVETFEGYPLYALIFYCFRCGDTQAALKIATQASSGAGAAADMATFVACLQRRAEDEREDRSKHKALPAQLWKKLNEEYNRDLASKPGADPFKVAMFMILGRFRQNPQVDLLRYVAPTTEDYMWLKLTLVWESEDKLPEWMRDTQHLSLLHLQESLLRLGEAHFNADGRNPLRYFKVLLMSQQFEQAVAYLVRTDFFLVGVHAAVALDYYGLLRRSQPSSDLLSSSGGSGAFSLNFVRIIRKYVEAFSRTNPVEAFHYLFLLRQPKGALRSSSTGSASSSSTVVLESKGEEKGGGGGGGSSIVGMDEYDDEDGGSGSGSGSGLGLSATGSGGLGLAGGAELDVSQEAVADLVLETKEFGLLIGTIRSDQMVTKNGCVYLFYPSTEAQQIIVRAARASEENGAHMDALNLYTLAERPDKVATILVKLLSRLVSSPVNNAERKAAVDLAAAFLKSPAVVRAASQAAGGAGAGAAASTSGAFGGAGSLFASPTRGGGSLSASGLFSPGSIATPLRGGASAQQQMTAETGAAVQSLGALMRLVTFFDLAAQGSERFDDALAVLDSLGVLPARDDYSDVEDKVARFERLDQSVKRNFADIALAVMKIYHSKYTQIKSELARSGAGSQQQTPIIFGSQTPRDATRQKILRDYRSKARALINFIGMNQLVVGADVNAKLVHIEALMS